MLLQQAGTRACTGQPSSRYTPCSGHGFFKSRPCRPQRPLQRSAASSGDKDDGGNEPSPDTDALKQKFFSGRPSDSGDAPEAQGRTDPGLPEIIGQVNQVNPYVLGRQARRALDNVWTQFTRLTSPTKSFIFDDVMDTSVDMEAASVANKTTVLVVGATGRVGKILTRKLLLRGYTVRALVRSQDGRGARREGDWEGLPAAVQVVHGDVGELADCKRAMRGVDKVIFCAAARTPLTGDLLRVDERGVKNVAKTMQDEFRRRALLAGERFSIKAKKEIADFHHVYHQLRWDIEFCGLPESERGSIVRNVNRAVAEINEDNNLIFQGVLFSNNAYADVGADINAVLPGGGHRTEGTEGLTLRAKGDGHSYILLLTTANGSRYSARFPTRLGYTTVRLPFTSFRPEAPGQPPLDPSSLSHISLRYEHRRATSAANAVVSQADIQRDQRFELQVDWIKALPGGLEPDFVLVSCAGTSDRPTGPPEDPDRAKRTGFKRRGEEMLRLSGLGYTIIRPGTLVEEPGGYRALVFDQGSRITERVSFADVADICMRSLHEPQARNKTFDVCYEYQPEAGLQVYELVATIPGRSTNYLFPALSTLRKNT